jgi:ankyrin repeat protein
MQLSWMTGLVRRSTVIGILLCCLACHSASANPLHEAIEQGKGGQLRTLLASAPKAWFGQLDAAGLTPLLLAIREEQLGSVEDLLSAGASPNQTNADNWSPLHEAAVRGSLEITSLLLEKGAKVRVQDRRQGGTPLHIACFHGSQAICEKLVGAGAELNVKDKEGFTPLFHARDQGHTKLAKWLESKGARRR